MCLSSVVAATALVRLLAQLRVPPVLVFILTGIAARGMFRSVLDVDVLNRFVKPACDVCLSLVGMLIGSHLNGDALGSVGSKMVVYLGIFFAVAFVVVFVATSQLFPQHAAYAPFVASIALERSSPEALAGITEQRAQGPYTASTMLTAAAMDCAALIAFVTCNAALGASSALEVLVPMALWTAAAAGVAIAFFAAMQRAAPAATLASVLVVAASFTLLHRAIRFELLLAAILTGSHMNFRGPHPTLAVLDGTSTAVNTVLFVFSGLRIDVVHMLGTVSVVSIAMLFVARLAALWCGSWAAATATQLGHPHVRWMGLVTQLAIALSLVHRLHDTFAEAHALADAAAAMVLCGLAVGPWLHVVGLKLSGECGQADSHASSPPPAPRIEA